MTPRKISRRFAATIGRRSFRSEQDRLGWLVTLLERRFTESLHPTFSEPDDVEVFVVCTSLVRRALGFTRGIQQLLVRGLPSAAGCIERSLNELWDDFRYLMREGSSLENARKLNINAVFEVMSFFDATIAELKEDPDLAPIVRRLEREKQFCPDEYAKVEEQRLKKKFHWSGQSRTALSRQFAGTKKIYQYFSWKAHSAMTTIRDVEWVRTARGAKILFKPHEPESSTAEKMSWRTGGVLYNIWNEYATQFGLQLVEVPDIRGPQCDNRSCQEQPE